MLMNVPTFENIMKRFGWVRQQKLDDLKERFSGNLVIMPTQELTLFMTSPTGKHPKRCMIQGDIVSIAVPYPAKMTIKLEAKG
jgi:hypothetical protein